MLDINTPKGQETLKYESRAIDLFNYYYPDLNYIHTPKDGSAYIDAVIIDNQSNVVSVVEQKSRNMSLKQLQDWNNEWLITYDKIDYGRWVGQSLGVPYLGFLYLIPDDLLIIQQISDKSGAFTCDFRTELTETQETINGGKITRNNAYINLEHAVHLEAFV